MDEVFADCVAPVPAIATFGYKLVEQMILSIPLAQAIRIVHLVLGRAEVIQGAVRVSGQAMAECHESPKILIRFQGFELLFESVRIYLAAQFFKLRFAHWSVSLLFH